MDGGMGRRDALRRAAVLVAGVFGLGLGSTSAVIAGPARSAESPTVFVLQGGDWHRDSASGNAGLPEEPGERATVYGTLFSDSDGARVGDFQAASFYGDSPFSPSDSANIELHTFRLGGDMIFGMGSGSESGGSFAVTGGSGRFAGARGSYVAEQSPYETGGDGTARFEFTLT